MTSSLTSESQDEKVLEAFIDHLALQKGRSPHTQRSYVTQARFFMEHLRSLYPKDKSPFSSCTSEDLRLYMRDISEKLSSSSQAQKVSALKNFLTWAQRSYELDPKILKALTRPKQGKKLIRVVDEEDIHLLLNFLEKRPLEEQLLFELLYGSGLRISEAAGLSLDDVLWSQKSLNILGKGRKRRQVPMTRRAEALLKQRKELKLKNSLIWHKAYDPRTLRKWVYGWPLDSLHPHLLRHSLASHLLRRGSKLPQIQKLLGHARLSTSERYTHLDPSTLLQIYDQSHPKIKD